MRDKSAEHESHVNYRKSHASAGYGEHYRQTYREGYYAELWNRIERPRVEGIMRRLRDNGAMSCLDFACGTGRVTEVAERFFATTVGVDVSDQMLAVARTACSSATLMLRDITADPLDRRFDVITAFRFFLNAEEPLRNQVLAALAKTISPEGTLIVNVHVNHSSPLGIAYRLRNTLAGQTTANTLSFQHMHELLQAHGFEVRATHWYGFYPRTGWLLNGLTRVLMMPVEKVFSVLPFLPRSWAQSFIIEAKLRKS